MENFSPFIAALQESIPKIIISILLVVGGFYLGRIAESFIRSVLLRNKADPGVSGMIAEVARWLIISLSIIVALEMFIDITAFLATLGVVGIAVGFALQDVLRNFAAGILILLQHPYRVGESVSISGFEGSVIAITARATEIQTNDGRLVTLPNANILNQPIINYTRSPKRRLEIPLRASYGSDFGLIRTTILEAIKSVPGYLDAPAPLVSFDVFGESSFGLTIYFWVDLQVILSINTARDRAIDLVSVALKANGIKIPVPIQQILTESH
jgi:small conductance mechanosensitive channel